MTAELKAMLDELMGKDRNMSLDEKSTRGEHWSDDHVCKSFLVRFCPHDLFTNTRADLGPCKGTNHDVKFREIYRASTKFKKVGYENAFIRTLENVVDDMERKIRRQHERLEHDEQYMRKEQEKADEFRNSRLDVLNKDIDDLLEKMAEAGAKGNVEEAQDMMKGVEGMRQEREAIKSAQTDESRKKIFLPQVKPNVPFINEMKHMEVCNICGAFLVVNDTQTRVDAHLTGKQHMGYDLIRRTIKELREEREMDMKSNCEALTSSAKPEAGRTVEDAAKDRSRGVSRERSRRLSKDRESVKKEDRYDKDGNLKIRGGDRGPAPDRSRDRRRSRDRGGDRRGSGRDRRDEKRRSRSRDRKSTGDKAKEEEKKEEGSGEKKEDASGETAEASNEIDGEKKEEKKEESRRDEKSRDGKSRERRRSRSKDRSRRSRSRDRGRRSRSKDRRRSRSRSHGRKRSRY